MISAEQVRWSCSSLGTLRHSRIRPPDKVFNVPDTDRRSSIMEHAAALFAEKGINASTVREIARAAGILSGSLYHHFDSKDAIVESIVVEYLQALAQRCTDVALAHSDPGARLHELVLVSLQVMHDHPHASEIYQDNRHSFEDGERFRVVRELASSVHETWAEMIDSGVAAGVFRTDVNARVFHRFLRDAVFLASRWHRPTEIYGIEDLADDTARIFLHGFTARADSAGRPPPGRGNG